MRSCSRAGAWRGVSKKKAPYARLSGLAKEILDAYAEIEGATPSTVAGEIRNNSVLISYFAIRRGDREKILGADHVRGLLKSNEPLQRAAAAAAANEVLGPKATELLTPLLRDAHPVVVESVLDTLASGVTRTETGKALVEALPKMTVSNRHKAMTLLGRLKYRAAVGVLEEAFRRRDGVDSPVACRALAAIQGRSFTDGITEFLYPDNPIELHTAILECMADNPAPVYYAKATQLLKALRNKAAVAEVVRRIALWSNQGVDLAITLLGNADIALADAAQAGLVRHLRATGTLPAGFLQRLSKSLTDRDGARPAAAPHVALPPPIESLESRLSETLLSRPDADFQQLFLMALNAEKRFLAPKLVQLAVSRWGEAFSKVVDQALQLSKEDAVQVRARLQQRLAAQMEQESAAMTVARMIESVGAADLKAPVKEIARHLDTPSLPVQMAVMEALMVIGGAAEAAEIEKRIGGAHWMLKRKIASALSHLCAENPPAGLFKLCEDPEPLVRISSVRSLEGIRHEKAYNILLKSLNDPDERVRSAACAGLRGFPDRKEVVDRLRDMLEDKDARVRANTIESMDAVLGRDPDELRFRIKPYLSDPNARVVINTAKALFSGDPDLAYPVLESYLRAPDPNLRAGAMWALGQLSRPDAYLCLHFHSLREKDPYVLSFAGRAAARMEGRPFYKDAYYVLQSTRTGGTA